jgi:hypothetical protein
MKHPPHELNADIVIAPPDNPTLLKVLRSPDEMQRQIGRKIIDVDDPQTCPIGGNINELAAFKKVVDWRSDSPAEDEKPKNSCISDSPQDA